MHVAIVATIYKALIWTTTDNNTSLENSRLMEIFIQGNNYGKKVYLTLASVISIRIKNLTVANHTVQAFI